MAKNQADKQAPTAATDAKKSKEEKAAEKATKEAAKNAEKAAKDAAKAAAKAAKEAEKAAAKAAAKTAKAGKGAAAASGEADSIDIPPAELHVEAEEALIIAEGLAADSSALESSIETHLRTVCDKMQPGESKCSWFFVMPHAPLFHLSICQQTLTSRC